MSILWQGKPAVLAFVHDTAEKIENERKYANTQAILKSTLESQSEVLMVGIDKDFNCLYLNKPYHDLKSRIFGLDIQIGDRLADNLPKDRLLERALSHFQDALSGESIRLVEEYEELGMTFDSIYNPIRGSDGEILGASAFLIDISERMALEKKLREKESQLKTIGDNTPAFLGILDADSLRFQYVNRMYEQSYGLPKEHILGKTIGDIAGDANYQNAAKYLAEALSGRRAGYERQFSLVQGAVWAHMDYIPQFDVDGKVERILILGVDITDRKQSEERIRKLLREKELILREVHHRIKNNLQVVVSILSIRVADSENEDANLILNEAIGEIGSMSLLYDKLYRSDYVGTLPVRLYFPELLSQAAEVFGGGMPLAIETDIEDIDLDAGKLSRLGIVINELVTNSLKYAFDGVADPRVTLRVQRRGSSVRLEYEDNGKGLPESFSLESNGGFGMQLIQALLQQIGGTMSAEIRKGAKFILDFAA